VTPQEIDYGVLDSAFYTFPRLLNAMEHNRNFRDVPGLIYKEGTDIIINPSSSEPDNFDLYPSPARHLLSNELYAEFPTERKNFTIMVTSKGCPRRCNFCEEGGTRFMARSPLTVVNEMEECYTKFNIREIDIFDVNFTWDKKRALLICNEIIRRRLDISWACRSRIDLVDDELLRTMTRAGCSRIYYGIESGSQKMLDVLNKGITLDEIRNTIKLTKKNNIKSLGFFLIGSPGETKETIQETVQFAKELDVDYIQFSKTTAKPMTGLWKQLVKETDSDYWRNYILGLTEEMALPRPWTTLSNEEIDSLTKHAYIAYCSRPMYLLRSALKVKSFREFKRKVLAFFALVFSQESRAETWFRRTRKYEAYNENF
jgi:anaerobic magnesium-protoporphyrin IX monomethyl ester cyclase